MHRRRTIPFLVAGLVAVAAGTVAFAGNSASAARPVSEAPAAAPDPRDRDGVKAAATRDIPTFGGSYLDKDGSTLHVWLTSPSEADASRSRTALGVRPDTGIGRTVVHRADYTFNQLTNWRSAMRSLLGKPGVTRLDIDETTNRISLSLAEPDRDRPAVTAALTRLGVPAAAVTVKRGAGFRTEVRDQVRPLHGGTQIISTLGATAFCTLGYPATRAGVTGWVTASHCSATRGAVDNGRFWQPTRPADNTGVAGTETVDTILNAGLFDCPAGHRCASADANFVATRPGVTIAQGRIARPPLNSRVWNGTDTFRVTSGFGFAALNTVVQKVGRTTGRTQGSITGECVDTPTADNTITLFCQQTASYHSDPGDSGSPVFRITNAATNDVTAVGIHWGGSLDPSVNEAVFTPLFEVELEIGNLNVCAAGFAC